MWSGKFLLPATGFQTDCDNLLRVLKQILASLPNETTPTGVTPDDATVGQSLWVTLHEVGHATFDMFGVPIGREEDAADNFATYIMLQFGEGQARRLIGGAAWAWRSYLGDYRRNPVVQTRLATFSSDHGQPQESFYNRLCLAFGANKVEFADAENFLPPTRPRVVHMSIGRWYVHFTRKSARMSIMKWPSRCWAPTGFRTRTRNPSRRDSAP